MSSFLNASIFLLNKLAILSSALELHFKIRVVLFSNAKSIDFNFQIRNVVFIALHVLYFKFLKVNFQIFVFLFIKFFQQDLQLLLSSYFHAQAQTLFLASALMLTMRQYHLRAIKVLIGIGFSCSITKTS